MPRSRKEKRQHNDSASEQRARVIKSGMYDGSGSSRDFVVSGHSTGSANTEMEALSHQVSMDAGKVPDSSDHSYVPPRMDSTYALAGDTEDVGGPELYGPKPPITGSGWVNDLQSEITVKKLLWGALGGAAVGGLGYLTYRFIGRYRRSSTEKSSPTEL